MGNPLGFLTFLGGQKQKIRFSAISSDSRFLGDLDKDKFQEDGSMAAFWVVNKQFQQFIDSQFTLDYDSQMIDKYFAKYTGIKVKQFRETLLQRMSNVKKSVAERRRHKRLYERRMNKRQLQKQESKTDLEKSLDADLVVTKSSGTESGK
ncbi:hypothetical protein Tco_1108431 [Tanacetum coccineum]